MAHASGLQFTLSLPGGEDVAVIDFTHREALSAPFELGVTLASQSPDISPADVLDHQATLTVWEDGEPLRRVHGMVSEFGRGDRGHRRTCYTLVIRPALWRLDLRHNSRIFQDVLPQDILATLCAERGLTDVAFALTREPAEREYCVQYRETDLAFVERLAAEEGLVYLHEFENAEGGAHRLVFVDASQVLPNVGERTYHGRAGGTPPRRHVRKLTQVSRVRPAAVTLKDYTFRNPAYDQLHEHPAPDLGEHAQRDDYEHYDYPGRYKADASGSAFTRIRLEALRRQALTAEAESDLPELAPGICFTLADHDIDALNRDWQVVAVVHHGEQPQALEEDAVGADGRTRYFNELVLAPADRAWRPEPPVRPRVDGPQVAVVVGPEGEEIHCDEHGRVKVQFPWDRYAEPNETASAWLRVSQGWAGGGYGAMAIPRIGHEVIVSFLEGDPDQPLITGRTYHAVNTPPYALPAHKTRTVLRTQSHKAEGFNELRFEDATGAEQIWLHAQKDLELLTLNDRTETIRRDSHLAIERHRLGEIHGDDHLTVHGQRHTQVKGEGGQHLTVHGSLHLEAGQAWLTESGRELHIKAGHKVVLNAGREITLKAGGSFIKLDASGVTLVGPRIKINAGGSPGTGSGQQAEAPRLPGEATPERSEDVTLRAHQQARLDSDIVDAPQGMWHHTQGFARGAAGVVVEAAEGLVDLAAYSFKTSPASWALEQLHPGYRGHSEALEATRETLETLRDDPGLLVDAFTEPYRDAMARGETGEALGRGTAELASVVFAPARAGQAGRAASRAGQLGRHAGRLPPPRGALTPDDFPQYIGLNHRRAAAGEHNAHLLMHERGFEPVGNTNGRYTPGTQGIDGVYRNANPPPEFVITEAKYNRARLGKTRDGRQMSDNWLLANDSQRLRSAGLNESDRRRIQRGLQRGDADIVEKHLIRNLPDGSMRASKLNQRGYVSGTPTGFQ